MHHWAGSWFYRDGGCIMGLFTYEQAHILDSGSGCIVPHWAEIDSKQSGVHCGPVHLWAKWGGEHYGLSKNCWVGSMARGTSWYWFNLVRVILRRDFWPHGCVLNTCVMNWDFLGWFYEGTLPNICWMGAIKSNFMMDFLAKMCILMENYMVNMVTNPVLTQPKW